MNRYSDALDTAIVQGLISYARSLIEKGAEVDPVRADALAKHLMGSSQPDADMVLASLRRMALNGTLPQGTAPKIRKYS